MRLASCMMLVVFDLCKILQVRHKDMSSALRGNGTLTTIVKLFFLIGLQQIKDFIQLLNSLINL